MQICFEREKKRKRSAETDSEGRARTQEGTKDGGGRERLIRAIFTSVLIKLKKNVKTCFELAFPPTCN